MNFKKEFLYDAKMGWGFNLVFFGILYLFYQLNIFDGTWFGKWIFAWHNWPIYAGIIFLLCKDYRLSAIFFIIAALCRINKILDFAHDYTNLLIPLILIIAGVVVICLGSHGKGR